MNVEREKFIPLPGDIEAIVAPLPIKVSIELGAVVGATYPQVLAELREVAASQRDRPLDRADVSDLLPRSR